MDLMIHRFENAQIMGDPEEYEEHTSLKECLARLIALDADTDFSYWAEDADGNIYNSDTRL